ncbi:hypothetical protein LSS_14792 [Leptospira santarosai serovar Shermani str. LT 821]|uniref:Uncharacterized protein n=1 Tax=Leptospira santarosai serovar Shermani str. LT 821 TaxID=758847 RepID=K8Y8I3_9LEPT|nr:hypothetical protein LSS_14792 [Leptospira santarosai serovar Shermani str. LT 821]
MNRKTNKRNSFSKNRSRIFRNDFLLLGRIKTVPNRNLHFNFLNKLIVLFSYVFVVRREKIPFSKVSSCLKNTLNLSPTVRLLQPRSRKKPFQSL